MGEEAPKRRYSSSRSLGLLEKPPINHNCLSEHAFFKQRDPKLLELLLGNVSMKVFLPGTNIIKEGDDGDCMYFLNHGEVEVLIGPEEKQVAKLGDGNLFGEMALLGMGKRAATVRALNFCDCRSIDANAFQACLQRFPTEKIYFAKLAAERMAAIKNVGGKVDEKPIEKLRRSGHAVRSMMRIKAKFRSCPPPSATDSLSQEEELLSPRASSAATSTGFVEDMSETSGANASQDPMLAELPASPPTSPKRRSSLTWHKRKFVSNEEGSLCRGSERSSYGFDRLSYNKDRFTSTTQSTDCPDDLRMTTCTVTSQSTDYPEDMWMTEPSGRLSFTALPESSDRLSFTASPELQTTASRFMDPMRHEVKDLTPVADSSIMKSRQTLPLQMKLNSTSCQEAFDQESVEKPGNDDAAGREVSSWQGDSSSKRGSAAKSSLQPIPKTKQISASYQDALDPVCFTRPILADVLQREMKGGSWPKRRSSSCNAAKSGHLPALRTKQRAVATWWNIQLLHCHS